MNELSATPPSPEFAPEEEVSLLDLLQVVVDNLRLLIFGPLVVGLIALAISFFINPTFTAVTTILPPAQQQSTAASLLQNLGALNELGLGAGLKNPNDQFVALIKSRSVQDKLVERFKLKERYDVSYLVDARKELASNTRVGAGKEGLISIAVDDEDPSFAAELANAHVDELRILLAKIAITEAQQRRVLFGTELAKVREELAKAERELLNVSVSSKVLKSSPGSAVGALASLQASIAAQQVKIGALRGFLAETAPEYKQALTELSALKSQLALAERAAPASDTADGEYIARFRNFKYFESLHDFFAKQYESARVDESRQGALVQVVDAAVAPEKKSRPQKAIIAVLTTLAAGFFFLVLVFVRQAIRDAENDSVRAPKLDRLRLGLLKAVGKSRR